MRLIGRKEEQKNFKHVLHSTESKLVAVYGRRRIGKTFLIRKYFESKFTFEITALHNGTMKDQLDHFVQTIASHGYMEARIANPETWMQAFQVLSLYLDSLKGKEKKVLFMDELPWFDTSRSKFLMAFEHFWNSYCTKRNDIVLIICGSSASWMIKKIMHNKGGLHNRVSERMLIQAFTLAETKLFLTEKGIKWSDYDIAQFYMIAGGIPYYLDGVRKGESVAQCVDRLFFQKTGSLYNEFEELYSSLFEKSENHVKIIHALAQSKSGLNREQLMEKTGLPSGGNLSTTIDELLSSGFIAVKTPFGVKRNKIHYRIDDFFTLFYMKFMRNRTGRQQESWTNLVKKQSWISWSGLAFERLCFAHIQQIKNALGLRVIETAYYSWESKNEDIGSQIDLLIDRADNIINLCEIKFTHAEFTIDKSYAMSLRNKLAAFSSTQKKKVVFVTMITTFGIKNNEYAKEIVQNQITLSDFFG
jgi:AAA+ ATPase superfamily predicted ATPase